jgi:uncharacterized protein YkwD
MYKLIFICILALIPLNISAQFSGQDAELLRSELSEKINKLRESRGHAPLLFNDTLKVAAEMHSSYMASRNNLTHTQPGRRFSDPKKRVEQAGGDDFRLVGENILSSAPQDFPLSDKELRILAEEMFQAWKNSRSHLKNMTDAEYVYGDFGFALSRDQRVLYVTHLFGSKNN